MRNISVQRILWCIRILVMIPNCWHEEDKCDGCFPMPHRLAIHLTKYVDGPPVSEGILTAPLWLSSLIPTFIEEELIWTNGMSFPCYLYFIGECLNTYLDHITSRPAPLTRPRGHDHAYHESDSSENWPFTTSIQAPQACHCPAQKCYSSPLSISIWLQIIKWE